MDLELAEQEGYADAFRAAPPALARQHGIAVATFDDVTCIRVADLPRSRVFNHVFGLGRSRPASDDDLDRVAEFYGDEIYFVALARDAEPGLAARLEARGFVPDYAWTRFRRGVEPPTPVESELRVQPIGPQHARDFGARRRGGLRAPRVHRPLALGALRAPALDVLPGLRPQRARSSGHAVLEWRRRLAQLRGHALEFRQRGAQGALLAARIRAAAELGCSLVVGETGALEEGRPSNSRTSVIFWRTMEKKRRRRSPNSEELDRRLEETSRLLEQRIAYHRALIAQEKARRQLPWYRRIFAA